MTFRSFLNTLKRNGTVKMPDPPVCEHCKTTTKIVCRVLEKRRRKFKVKWLCHRCYHYLVTLGRKRVPKRTRRAPSPARKAEAVSRESLGLPRRKKKNPGRRQNPALVQCAGLSWSQGGRPCTRMVTAPSEFCWQHAR